MAKPARIIITGMLDNDIWYIRQQTYTGRPSDDTTFFDQLETLLQRNVKP